MTDEELKRTFDFVTEQHRTAAELMTGITRSQVEHERRLTSLEESHRTLVEADASLVKLTRSVVESNRETKQTNASLKESNTLLLQFVRNMDERLDRSNGRTAGLEEASRRSPTLPRGKTNAYARSKAEVDVSEIIIPCCHHLPPAPVMYLRD